MFVIHRPTDAVNRLSRLFDEAFRSWPASLSDDRSLVGQWVPPVDVLEEHDAVRIMAELPGVKPDDVRISLENGVLTIRGEKQQVAEQKTERVHRYERNYGVFERSFSVPNTVDAGRISAEYADGVLTVTLPKQEQAKPRQISVAVRRPE